MTSSIRHSSSPRFLLGFALALLWPLTAAQAQTCLTGSELDTGARTALETTAQQLFRMSATGDYAGLRANAVASLASNFGGVEAAVGQYKADFTGAQASPTSIYVLEATGSAPLPRAEFFCGIFNSPDRVAFIIPNLPPGRYAAVTESVSGGKEPVNLTLVLQQEGSNWKLAGYTVKPLQVGGHDLPWYLAQARQYKASGHNVAAYLYYLEAWYLSQPTDIEYTAQQDKLAAEMQQVKPPDWPSPSQPLTLAGNGKTYRVTQMFPDAVGNDLDLIVKYQAVSNLSDTAAAFQDNMTVIKAVVARYPELRQAFAGVVARAVDPSGRDYGTLLAMKDVK